MPIPFSADDLGRVFDARILTKGRTLILLADVTVTIDDKVLAVTVHHEADTFTATIEPALLRDRVVFFNECSCQQRSCAHMAAGALAALDRFPALRRAGQQSFMETMLTAEPGTEREVLVMELAPADLPDACAVSALMLGARTGRRRPTTPAAILEDLTQPESIKLLARMLGSGDASRCGVAPDAVDSVLGLLARIGKARWHATGKMLTLGADRTFQANTVPDLPPRSGVILGAQGPWYVDAVTGAVGRMRIRQGPAPRPAPAPAPPPRAPTPAIRPASPTFRRPEPARPPATGPARPPLRTRPTPAPSYGSFPTIRRATPIGAPEPVILDAPLTPVLRLQHVECPDDTGRLVPTDALVIAFDYDGTLVPWDDDRQFVQVAAAGGPQHFVRRDKTGEAAAMDLLRPDGFTQMRVSDATRAKGRIVHVYRGRDAGERWRAFTLDRIPALMAAGWRNLIDKDFGPREVQAVGIYDMRVTDVASGPGAEEGAFALDFGIEIDGVRVPLLPILLRLLDRGGMETALVVEGELITSLDDGRLLKLPAERIGRLLAVMSDLIAAAHRTADGALVLDPGEAASVLDLEDLLPTRWENAARIEAYAARFRDAPEILPVTVPESFRAVLRPYQQHGVDWLQHLREHELGGLLADDMGLGKTAQTIAHLVIEHAEGRLDRPALIVVPTSLVANWGAEIHKFAPHLRTVVLHGLDRHEKRASLDGVAIVITTYTVLTRDIEEMKALPWHIVVLDEAQVIKSPDSKATQAVCQLDTRHRLCLSGTPIENNLQEIWSEFAFLMPGLLGDRRRFAKRFRTPIEKNNDQVRRVQLVRRIRPFLLRRTKAEVATDLPPKHTILRRVDLGPDQRALYEAIRATLHDSVREKMAGLTAAQGRIVMLDALLKLRQVCCDPRLVKLPSARDVTESSKLDDLMEMVSEMVPEGRRILLFSQFTSMLDLIKPRLTEAGIPFVELRGDTRDRAEPVRAFEEGEVPVFLISLKAGGRGLNLTAADTVIHYDPWWNPAVEDQASDRAHRIGQTKPVFVYKLLAADTVEDRILELQQRKADLARIALGGEGELDGLEVEDLAFLFGDEPEQLAA